MFDSVHLMAYYLERTKQKLDAAFLFTEGHVQVSSRLTICKKYSTTSKRIFLSSKKSHHLLIRFLQVMTSFLILSSISRISFPLRSSRLLTFNSSLPFSLFASSFLKTLSKRFLVLLHRHIAGCWSTVFELTHCLRKESFHLHMWWLWGSRWTRSGRWSIWTVRFCNQTWLSCYGNSCTLGKEHSASPLRFLNLLSFNE